MPYGEFLPWILGSVLLLLLGYLLNGWRERSFERRKTNYHTKLKLFGRMNVAIVHAIIALSYFRQTVEAGTKGEDDMQLLLKLKDFASWAATEDVERGSVLIQRLGETYPEFEGEIHGDVPTVPSDRLQQMRTGLMSVWGYLLSSYMNEIKRHSWDVLSVGETSRIQTAVARLQTYLGKESDIQKIVQGETEEERMGVFRTTEEELQKINEELQASMRVEMGLTMKSWLGRVLSDP